MFYIICHSHEYILTPTNSLILLQSLTVLQKIELQPFSAETFHPWLPNFMYAQALLGGTRPALKAPEIYEEKQKNFLIGQDIKVTEQCVLPAQETSLVTVELPLTTDTQDLAAFLEKTSLSTRSRFAQAGLEADQQTAITSIMATKRRNEKGTWSAEIPVINHSLRKIRISPDTGLFYFYLQKAESIEGNDIVDLVRKKQIEIDGEFNRDWKYWTKPDGKIIGIEFCLKEDFKLIHPGVEEIVIPGDDDPLHNHGRSKVDTHLRKSKGNPKQNLLYISEFAAHLTLHGKIHGVIDPLIYNHGSRHINSIVLNAHNTGSNKDQNVRVEITGAKGGFPKSVFVRFSQD